MEMYPATTGESPIKLISIFVAIVLVRLGYIIILYELNPIGLIGTNDRTTAEIQWCAPLVQKTRVQDHLFVIIYMIKPLMISSLLHHSQIY